MAMIHLMKLLCDASVYYMFAAPVAASLGGGRLLPALLVQSLVCGLCHSGKKRWLQLLLLMPLAGTWLLCLDSWADLIALTPVNGYILWQVLRGGPLPDLEQQRDMLIGSWKYLLAAVAVSLVLSGLKIMLPFGLIFLLASVALLRTLRHTPEVYQKPSFQLINLAAMAVVPVGAACFSSAPVAKTLTAALKLLYTQVLLKLLMALLWLPLRAVQWLIDLLAPLFSVREDEEELSEMLEATTPPETPEMEAYVQNTTFWSIVWAVLAAAAVVAVILLFRHLAGKRTVRQESSPARQNRFFEKAQRKAPALPESAEVQSIRRQYRRYLKLCRDKGIDRQESTTSRDIYRMAQEHADLRPHAGSIRKLYIRARYAGRADTEDVRRMKKLCAETKK